MGEFTFKQKVMRRLSEDKGYDFQSEFWTDDMMCMFQEIVEAAENEIDQELNKL